MDFNAKSYTTSSKYFELLKAFNIRELLFLKCIPYFRPKWKKWFCHNIQYIFSLNTSSYILQSGIWTGKRIQKKLFQKRQNHFKLKSLDVHSRISLQDLNAIEIHILYMVIERSSSLRDKILRWFDQISIFMIPSKCSCHAIAKLPIYNDRLFIFYLVSIESWKVCMNAHEEHST